MNILIVCAFGASSGILKRNIMEEMKKRNISGSVSAYSVEDLELQLENKDIVLVAPQLRIQLNDIKKVVSGKVPVNMIDSVDYGMMNAANILEKSIKYLSSNSDK